ncbi:MAG: uroporphyrinogen-III C-methyltransferase [Candidatus Eremiobacteraeota bacterium]|nr:uroporphyrinogen-III C-methyltransferase [Candidatus Eremiobacteraeota bacterium]MBC5803635.1 uroporphyrinogen-III C-methyltransferase [Candidatus Eremiobacteraeota bacterium]MBC5822115.1 uroporphyrinogen-III C-methyltransferase [Candidatus Eremiobacteraeota bacterium]
MSSGSPDHRAAKTSPGYVWLVGAGPGDPGLLTLKAARALRDCDALVYDYLASPAVLALASPQCEKIYVGKKAGAHTLSQDEITELIVRLGSAGRRVVRLKGGDVFVFARGGEEAAALHAAGVPFEIVLGITSALAAPAYAGIPLTHRDYNTSFTVATGHEDPSKGYSSLDFAKLANPAQTLILLMAMGNLAAIVNRLRDNGLPGELPVAIVREATKPAQETIVATLATIVAEVERTQFAAPAVVVIGNVVREREAIRWFDAAPLFGKRVLVTRPERESDDLTSRLWEAGAQPVPAPTIAIAPPDDAGPAGDAVRRLDSYAWVVFTSPNGVAACFRILEEQGGDARRFGRTRVAAIGRATAQSLRTHGIVADYVPGRFIAEQLGSGLLERTDDGETILLFGAQEMRRTLGSILRERGRIVESVAAYKTTAVASPDLADLAETCDVWTFASGSAVRSFVANVPGAADLAQDKTIACFGPVTAAALREAGLAADVVAEEAGAGGLIAALTASPPRMDAAV